VSIQADNRPLPPPIADERATLEGFLDYHRATLLWKCDGLTDDQLRARSVEPSSMSLLGLIRHMHDVEQTWFLRRVAGRDVKPKYSWPENIDGEFDDVEGADVAADFAAYAQIVAQARVVAGEVNLADEFVHERTGERLSVRWLLLHMIEEYARHNGHADLLRERLDGVVGE
jgi:hypothetical protein